MMEKNHRPSATTPSFSSSADVAATADGNTLTGAANTTTLGGKTSSNNIQSSLKSLNKASYKISKPLPRNPIADPKTAPPSPPPPQSAGVSGVGGGGGGPPYQPQPPVYNIDKNNFRDVVQKLTGSPVVSRPQHAEAPLPPPPRSSSASPSTPTPATAPTSRLHRIRPPPLAHLSPRPPPFVPAPQLPAAAPWTRPPLSPLPPLPTVIAAAESPISAYMRRLRGGGLPGLAPSPAAASMLPLPSSPLGLGCLLSPRTAYQMMMTAPGLQFPTSPGLQLASPRLGDP